MSEFTCYKCKETFNKIQDETWSDYKAAEEFLISYPDAKNHPTHILCDDCHIIFKEWFSKLTNEEKKSMREI